MVELAIPKVRYQRSYLAALDEYIAAGQARSSGLPDIAQATGHEIRLARTALDDPSVFTAHVELEIAEAMETTPRPPGRVPSTNRWLVEGSEFLGHLSIRHRLTPVLVELGGHIGYAIRPSARRRGYGTRQLALALPVARGLGLGRLLVTCDEDNIGSARIIERSGGVLEDVRGDKRRYWIDVQGQ